MIATSVASSSQMFPASSPFGQATRSQTPAFNPFAANRTEGEGGAFGLGGAGDSTRTKRKKNGRTGDQSDNEGKRKPNNPFQNLGDGGNKQNHKGEGRQRKGFDTRKNLNGDLQKLKPKPQFPKGQNGNSNPFGSRRSPSPRPTSSSSTESSHFPTQPAINNNDPHARRVYEQLRKDGISPPPWPSQPGNPKNKAEMSKFREKYEAYRVKVRASLTKAGLIDDPTKRRTLQDAIDFKGICEDMCPEYEKITRITEMDVHQPEKSRKTTFAKTQAMVKKLARSAAGQEAPLPMDVRSIPALQRTLDYLIDTLLRHDGNLPILHGFLWDRTRAIRRDFTFFSSLTPEDMKIQVYVLENIARFHVTALHLLSQEGNAPEDFVEQQELEQLGKCLLSLRDAYDDCNEQGILCENEAEFRAYYLVFHGYDPNILETLQRQWKPNLWRDSDEVRTAVSLVEALQNTQDFHGPLKDAPSLAASAAYHSYFRIVEDPKISYTMACFAECHFPRLRRSILTAVKKALARPKDTSKDVTAAVLNKFLRFDTIEEAIEFAELHEIEFGSSEEDPSDLGRQYLILDNRKALPHHRLQHQFSQRLVEKKRGSRPLPDLIHQSVFEDPNAASPVNGTGEESLFVSDKDTTTRPLIPSGPKPTAQPNPFSSFGQPSGSSGASGTTGFTPGTATPGSIFNTGTTARPPQNANPFATTSKDQKPPFNPFAPIEASSAPSPQIPASTPASSSEQSTPGQPLSSPFSAFPQPGSAASSVPTQKPLPSVATSTTAAQPSLNPSAPSFSFLKPQTTPSAGSPSNEGAAPAPPKPIFPTAAGPDVTKAPVINIIPPTTQEVSPTPSVPTTAPVPFPSILGTPSTQAKSGAQPTVGVSLSESSPAQVSTEKPVFTWPSTSGTASISKPDLAPTTTLNKPTPRPIAPTTSTSAIAKPVEEPKGPIKPAKPPPPPRDLVGDFTKWFVLGDEGLLEEFKVFMLDDILRDVFTTFQTEQEEKRRKEEEAQAIAEADSFRIYNLSVKYFYRWRDNARELRLRALRRSGRDQIRTYYEAQRTAELKAQKEAARRAAKERAEIEGLDRPEELRDFMKQQRVSRRNVEDDLLASGVLSGLRNEEEAIARIVRRAPSTNGSVISSGSKGSQSGTKGGAKTQALREQLLRGRSASLRRSLPPLSSGEASNSESGNRRSRVSERWRLKAMGIIQMPDGTALPEAMADEIRYARQARSGSGNMGPPNGIPARRASIAELERPPTRPLSASESRVDALKHGMQASQNKRKRSADDDGEPTETNTTKQNNHKRVMSDAANLIAELRAMREELDEGASWFKEQNERLQSELSSRGSTPWDPDT